VLDAAQEATEAEKRKKKEEKLNTKKIMNTEAFWLLRYSGLRA
jgi:hypothetical protein